MSLLISNPSPVQPLHNHHMVAMNATGGGEGTAAPPGRGFHHRHMMMHMTFFWGENAEILFHGWPGYNNTGMYAVALVVVFLMAIIVEWLSHCNYIKESSNRIVVGLIQTLMYAIRCCLGYMVMLAVMSFNGGVFIVVVAGHTVGFFVFGSRFGSRTGSGFVKTSDLPPVGCNC